MKIGTFGIVGLLALGILGGAVALAQTKPMEDPMLGYYGNTYSCYWPGVFECHHWWGADKSETYFEARWLPEGMITMKTIEGRYRVFAANGQWCATNARTVAPTRPKDAYDPGHVGAIGDAGARAKADAKAQADAQAAADAADEAAEKKTLNNNENDCAPIVDAVPGDHWYKLHQNGQYQDEREQYVLLPGHL